MEAEVLTQGAGALSTFGLYAICAALSIVCIHFYRRLNTLEAEFRSSLVTQTEKMTAANDELRDLATKTQEVIKANTAAFEDISRVLRERDGERGSKWK